MRKIYCSKCKTYKEFEKHKLSWNCDKNLVLSSIPNKYGSKDEKIFKEEESIKVLKIIVLIDKIKNTKETKRNISQEFRLKNVDESKNYFLEYLDYLIDANFQGVNRLFILLIENNVHRGRYTRYFI